MTITWADKLVVGGVDEKTTIAANKKTIVNAKPEYTFCRGGAYTNAWN